MQFGFATMAENECEEVVVELCRVEIGPSVAKFVQAHAEEFEVDDNSGKVRSKATGMEFGSTKKGSDNDGKLLAALEQYVKGKKYKFAKENLRARTAAAAHAFLVPHRHHKKWLYCLFCQKQVNLIVEDIENHVSSRKCKFHRTLKSLKRVEGEEGEELVVEELAPEESEGESSEEDVESLFFDYNGNGDSEEDEEERDDDDEEEEEEEAGAAAAGAAVAKGKKPVKERKKRKAAAPSASSKKRRMK